MRRVGRFYRQFHRDGARNERLHCRLASCLCQIEVNMVFVKLRLYVQKHRALISLFIELLCPRPVQRNLRDWIVLYILRQIKASQDLIVIQLIFRNVYGRRKHRFTAPGFGRYGIRQGHLVPVSILDFPIDIRLSQRPVAVLREGNLRIGRVGFVCNDSLVRVTPGIVQHNLAAGCGRRRARELILLGAEHIGVEVRHNLRRFAHPGIQDIGNALADLLVVLLHSAVIGIVILI